MTGRATRFAIGLGVLILAGLGARDAAASHGGHGGFHGGHGGFHGGFHGHGAFFGFGFGFGFPGCCYSGVPFGYGYAYPYYAAPPVAYASPPSYAAPAPSGAPPADTADCREYQTTVTIDGRPQAAHGYACRQPDGSWRLSAPR